MVLGFLSRTGLVLFLRYLQGFTDFTDFVGCRENPQNNHFLFVLKKRIEKGKTLRTKKVVDIENENLVTSRKCCGLLMQGDVF